MKNDEILTMINNMGKSSLISNLGMQVTEIEYGKIVMTMPVDERTTQPFGFLHGGASVALAETAASIGGYFICDKETEIVFGLEINANHLKSKKDGLVTAFGELIHKGKSTQVWEVRLKNEDNEIICISRCTLAVKSVEKSRITVNSLVY